MPVWVKASFHEVLFTYVEAVQKNIDAKLSKEDPTHLGSNPLKKANNQITVQSPASRNRITLSDSS